MVLRILEAKVCGPYMLELTFSNGVRKRVNVMPLLDGPIFEPLRDPAYFARAVLDPVIGTVVWPNEADFAPEALYDLPDENGAAGIAGKRVECPASGGGSRSL